MTALALFLVSLLAQDPLDAILKRLSDDSFEVREAAQKELKEYLTDDQRIDRVRATLPGLEVDARQRVKEALDLIGRWKAGLIAYIRRDDTQELWVIRPDGTEARPLTRGLDIDFNHVPAWSPDAGRIVFVRDSHVYVVDVDGKNLKQLTRDRNTQDSDPQWLRDGSAIVFSCYMFDEKTNSGTSRWKSIKPDGTDLRVLPEDAWSWRLGRDVSPDGKRRASDWSGRVGVSDLDGRNRRELTGKDENVSPVWSRDGKWIVYVSSREQQHHLYVVSPETKEERRITEGEGYHYSPTWSPDSRRLAFVSSQPGFEGICVIDLDGKNRRLLAARQAYTPSWSPSLPLPQSK